MGNMEESGICVSLASLVSFRSQDRITATGLRPDRLDGIGFIKTSQTSVSGSESKVEDSSEIPR